MATMQIAAPIFSFHSSPLLHCPSSSHFSFKPTKIGPNSLFSTTTTNNNRPSSLLSFQPRKLLPTPFFSKFICEDYLVVKGSEEEGDGGNGRFSGRKGWEL